MKARVASILLRILARTWRFSLHGEFPSSPAVVAFWHDEMLPVWTLFARKKSNLSLSALISLSKDGEILAQLLHDWGYELVRGSSSKGGKEALEQMTTLAARSILLITPDGPRGPRHQMKPGAVIAAQRACVPLYLCRIKTEGWRFEKSWDKFLLPYPFARIEVECREQRSFMAKEVSVAVQESEWLLEHLCS